MFTDKEHRILLSAISREEEVCRKVDEETCRERYEISLMDICNSIRRKVHDIQHKYQWHDLRKNPLDLPKDEGEYLVAVQHAPNEFEHYEIGHYELAYGYGFGWHDYFHDDIIKWREIEPHEGGE